MSQYDFALQWLHYLGNSIYNKGNQVLVYNENPQYEISPLNTRIKIGEELGEESDEKTFSYMSFLDFERMGFSIKALTDVKWKDKQRVAYIIIRKRSNTTGISYDAFKKSGMRIEHDAPDRRFRLIGENVVADDTLKVDAGVGPWVIYEEDRPKEFIRRKPYMLSNEEIRFAMQSNRFGGASAAQQEYRVIHDIPMIFSEEKYIVCIPRDNICQKILITGQARKGKSLLGNGMSGRIFYIWGDRVGWIIDPQNQFYNISAPQDFNEFIKMNAWINEEPKPIPAVQFYLACKNPAKMAHKNISFKLTLNFLEFLNKFPFYAYGTKSWQLDKPEKYLSLVTPYLKDVENDKELKEKLYECIPDANDEKKGEGIRSMIFKWQAAFHTIFNEKFTSNLYQGDPLATDELEVRFNDGFMMKGHPFIMAMEAGLVPVINTSLAPDKQWVRNYLADTMQKILTHQKLQGQEKRRHRLWIIADEMQQIYEEKSGRRKDNVSISFESLYRQGGFNDIGVIANTQSLERLPYEMVKNATHICCVYTQSKKERNIIKDIFELPPEVVDKLAELKTREIMIFSNEPFVIYDKWGRRKVVTDRKWFKGKIIPPINHHESPKILEE